MVKLFIGNLPREATEQEIRSLFEQYGKVLECDIIKNYGFVHIEDKTAAEDAIRNLHHYKLHGVNINVEASKNKSKASTKLHVGNISPTCTNQELRAKFEEYGPVIECDIVKDYAFVHMERAEDAVEAIRGLDNTEFQEIQFLLPRFSAKLTWTSEEGGCSQDTSGVTPFQMSFEIDEKPRNLMTDCVVIKHFLHKIIVVHHKVRFNFSVMVNGILSTEVFGAENEPTLSLSNGVALVLGSQHYVSEPKSSTTGLHYSRLHPVLGHPVALFLPDDVAGMSLSGKLTLTPAAALCPSPKVFSSQQNRLSSVSIFLYGPLGLPLILSDQGQPSANVFRDPSYFIDWKKYHLSMVPNLDHGLDKDLVLPDAHYLVESSEGTQSQNMDPQGLALLLFLFIGFHSGFPVQQMEILGVHAVLTTHLSAILTESHGAVRDSIQSAVDQVLVQHHQATKAHQKLQTSLSVAVNSIMSVVTGSTCGHFRRTCLQALEAGDTQEFGAKLHKIFHDITQHRLPYHCSCNTEQQLTPEKKDSAQSIEDTCEKSLEFLAETSGRAEKRLKSSHGLQAETQAVGAARDRGPPQPTARLRSGGPPQSPSRCPPGSVPLPRCSLRCPPPSPPLPRCSPRSPPPPPQDALWLEAVSNLSEWLSPGPKL
ncbi:type 2 DNA topoisomerase 6 subunit B-like isoform X4 [Nannospalax galili]|uniref:type 2 DNA topoisomerase 6 subunit B-like isoform X4 n=1 Tax=Nannospalax galili TaxID=1026970 RepID=UPI00111C04F3|nr:type 2 DNA topoisomerase 6 subunit B-like isoform X4 [Nannospalax galili]